MITKLLVNWIKKNKIQLKSEETASRFYGGMAFELLLGVILGMVGSVSVFCSPSLIGKSFGIVILIYGASSVISYFAHLGSSKSLWEWKWELTPKYYSTGTVLKRDEGYSISFKPGSWYETIYQIEKNGLVYKTENISSIGIRNSETIRYTEIENLLNFIKEKQSFPYTEIEEIDLTHKVESPYIKEIREEREASVILTLPDDFVAELKAFVHKDDDKKEQSQHIVN